MRHARARLQRTAAALAAALSRGAASGFAVHVRHGGHVVCDLVVGHAHRYVSHGPRAPLRPLVAPIPLTHDHAFDIASVSKVVATTLLAQTLVGEGKLRLDEPLARLLPLPGSPGAQPLRLEHLLTHRGGLPAWVPLYFDVPRPSALLPALAPYVARARPGERRVYSDLGFLLLGAAIEASAGQSLDALMQARATDPLGLRRACYTPARRGGGAVVATGHGNVFERRMIDEPSFGLALPEAWPARPSAAFSGWRDATLVGEVGDGNAHYAMQGVAGHSGLFATAAEVTALSRALTGPAGCPEVAALQVPQPVREVFLRRAACGDYLGWFDGAELSAAQAPPDCRMMRGFSGCVVVACPSLDLHLALLSNREHVDAQGNYVNLRPLIAEVLDAWCAPRVDAP